MNSRCSHWGVEADPAYARQLDHSYSPGFAMILALTGLRWMYRESCLAYSSLSTRMVIGVVFLCASLKLLYL